MQLYEDYKDHADFLTVYVREAHPTDEWQMKSNLKDKDDVCYAQPKTLAQRVVIANDFIKRFKFNLPFGIDDMSNAADLAYSAWPERLYVIDESGRIAYRGGMGPFNYNPAEVREWLAARYGAVKHDPPKKPADAAAGGTKSVDAGATSLTPAATAATSMPAATSTPAATPSPAAAAPVPASK